MIAPWLESYWQRLIDLDQRLPHALLFVGPPGLGKRDLVEHLAARLLCDTPAENGAACGQCAACRWRLSGNHPDLYRVVPASAQDAEEGDEAAPAAESTAKAKSSQILIDQIREIQDALAVTGHHGSRRVVIIDPAEAMNVFTANALLKLLEEPPAGCSFLLVSSAPRRLLPTIRSRCQQWAVGRPGAGQLEQWLAAEGPALAPLLTLCGGMPMAAKRLAEQGGAAWRDRFVKDLAAGGFDPLRLAGQWESWLKSKDALASGFNLVMLVDWFQRWVSDLAVFKLGGVVRFFPDQTAALSDLAKRADVAALSNCYNETLQIRRVVTHPLNLRLFLEDMLMRYARAFKGSRN